MSWLAASANTSYNAAGDMARKIAAGSFTALPIQRPTNARVAATNR
jgi:hypothetical protein